MVTLGDTPPHFECMGILANPSSRACVTLTGHCLIGRSSACFLCLRDPTVSAEHARIRWTGENWEIRDMGSRNGTTLGGRLLRAGETAILSPNTEIVFGEVDGWTLIDDAGPLATARALTTGRTIHARDGLLALNVGDAPFPYVYAKGETWLAEDANGLRVVCDGDVLEVGATAWTLHLPKGPEITADSGSRLRWLARLRWRFSVSSDEEYVCATVEVDGQTLDLGARAHHYLLLTLARLRRGDNDGWVYNDELENMLGLDTNALNVQVYRARAELGKLGVVDAPDVIERRRSTHQVRTAIREFELQTV